MRMKLLGILCLSVFLFSGCYLRSKKFWAREEAKIEQCRGQWKFSDLSETQDLKVLLFRDRFYFDVNLFPAFIIGVTSNSDTVGVVDKDFEGILKIGQQITISPAGWTPSEKETIRPVYSVYPKSKTNDLHCAAKEIFYAKIGIK